MIKFPKMHVAASVVNRIMNAKAHIDASQAASNAADRAPNVPDSVALGGDIDAELNAPQAPVSAEPMLAEEIALKGLL